MERIPAKFTVGLYQSKMLDTTVTTIMEGTYIYSQEFRVFISQNHLLFVILCELVHIYGCLSGASLKREVKHTVAFRYYFRQQNRRC
jgi:hypothetical protein